MNSEKTAYSTELAKKAKEAKVLQRHKQDTSGISTSLDIDSYRKNYRKIMGSIDSKIIIAHEDIWVKLLTSGQMYQTSIDHLIDSDIILMTERTRLNIKKDFPDLVEYYRIYINPNIENTLKSLVVPERKLLFLSSEKMKVICAAMLSLGIEHKGKVHTNKEIKEIINQNINMIEGIAATEAYIGMNIKFITEDKNIILFTGSRKRVIPKIKDLIDSEIVDIGQLLKNIKDNNTKFLGIPLPRYQRKNITQELITNQEYFRELIEADDKLIQKCIEIDKFAEENPEEDDTTIILQAAQNLAGVEKVRRDNISRERTGRSR